MNEYLSKRQLNLFVFTQVLGHHPYIPGPFGNPDKFRNGILYLGIGPLEVGYDSEVIRNLFQNKIAHDRIVKSPYFRDLRGTSEYKLMGGDRFYFQFGWGGIW